MKTVVGEARYQPFSGGQKAAHRHCPAPLSATPRILILDEFFSPGVDTQNRRAHSHTLAGHQCTGRTTIFDLATALLPCATPTRFVVPARGAVSSSAARIDELLARGGYYADLYQKQLLEEELERA